MPLRLLKALLPERDGRTAIGMAHDDSTPVDNPMPVPVPMDVVLAMVVKVAGAGFSGRAVHPDERGERHDGGECDCDGPHLRPAQRGTICSPSPGSKLRLGPPVC